MKVGIFAKQNLPRQKTCESYNIFTKKCKIYLIAQQSFIQQNPSGTGNYSREAASPAREALNKKNIFKPDSLNCIHSPAFMS